jgi:anti-sigma factor RsiW
MQCERASDLIGPYLDGELTAPERQSVAGHLETCAVCATRAHDLEHMGRQIAWVREDAPRALAARIRASLAAEAGNHPVTVVAPAPARVHGGATRMAAAIAGASLVSSVLTWAALTASVGAARLEGEIATAHIRSLLQDSPYQVASSDSHTVKPWFSGRIDFAPDVKDLTADGFPLAGGRLDYIGDRRVGALVYKRRLHIVNVFTWPAAGAEPRAPQEYKLKGYNAVAWSRGGVDYWAISDLNIGELKHFQSLL